jgi:hypothetical protein
MNFASVAASAGWTPFAAADEATAAPSTSAPTADVGPRSALAGGIARLICGFASPRRPGCVDVAQQAKGWLAAAFTDADTGVGAWCCAPCCACAGAKSARCPDALAGVSVSCAGGAGARASYAPSVMAAPAWRRPQSATAGGGPSLPPSATPPAASLDVGYTIQYIHWAPNRLCIMYIHVHNVYIHTQKLKTKCCVAASASSTGRRKEAQASTL